MSERDTSIPFGYPGDVDGAWILGYSSFIVVLIGWVKFTFTTGTVTNSQWIPISIST